MPLRVLAFTGTRRGLTEPQRAALAALLANLRPDHEVLAHGAAVGADEAAHAIARDLGYATWLYPSDVPGQRGACPGADREAPPRPPLDRNRDIVAASHSSGSGPFGRGALVACPAGPPGRSGTWGTVARARGLGLRVYLVYPDGSEPT